jgi:hypothetical protein
MKCVNCQADINSGGLVCPYCHFHPFIIGYGPFDGASGQNPLGWNPYQPKEVERFLNPKLGLLSRIAHALTGRKIGSTEISQPGTKYKRYRCNKCGFDIVFSPETHCSACGNEL